MTRRHVLGMSLVTTISAVGGGLERVGGSCQQVAQETAGPFPADGSNSSGGAIKNVLTDPRVLRRDIRSDFDGKNPQVGVPFELSLKVRNLDRDCEAWAGCFVYIWHCTAQGAYSQYSGMMAGGDHEDHHFLRGVQATDEEGVVRFQTIFPGRYDGRATHIHFEVYAPDAKIGTVDGLDGKLLATSQLAFPESLTDGEESPYHDVDVYGKSLTRVLSNENDNVFSDGTETEMLTIVGDSQKGYQASIEVAISETPAAPSGPPGGGPPSGGRSGHGGPGGVPPRPAQGEGTPPRPLPSKED
ncbi:protocatechuate 3,4-dioxygenase beta subunit [Haloferula luteola]|uniref:Protocatechuate 3,4-dioxygenase beta subunit n=1 Tax=Haloferula luteola TaxID=595692 RepID=A0A840V446_9BACT|nr:hypothetical protein [Haloferula luteola]MBB5352785.1 protocatechuate 3,4-dioxygenase beta subunit [Haloferula luteola]